MRPLTLGVLVSAAAGRSSAPIRPPSDRFVDTRPPAVAAEPEEGSSRSPAATAAFEDDLEEATDRRSGASLCAALRELGHRAFPIPVTADLDLALRHLEIDACLLALHGRRGGRGDVQALLTLRGVPFAGPDGTAAALAFDKIRARHMLAYHNLPVPTSLALGPTRKTQDRELELLGWPCYVKPRRGALGRGVTLLDHVDRISDALGAALQVDREVILERALPGREVQVVVMGDRVLGSLEVLSRSPGACETICPPNLSRVRLEGVHGLARRAVAALGLHDGLTRVDILVDERLNEFVLEVEPLPPLDRDGVVARVAAAAGLGYGALVTALLDRLVLRASAAERDHDPQPAIVWQ